MQESYTNWLFGDHLYTNGAYNWLGNISRNHFAGEQRDAESGFDYFGARYNASQLRRFMTPDPGPLVFTDPQTLDRCVYTADNPVTYTDPTGLYMCKWDGGRRSEIQRYLQWLKYKQQWRLAPDRAYKPQWGSVLKG